MWLLKSTSICSKATPLCVEQVIRSWSGSVFSFLHSLGFGHAEIGPDTGKDRENGEEDKGTVSGLADERRSDQTLCGTESRASVLLSHVRVDVKLDSR